MQLVTHGSTGPNGQVNVLRRVSRQASDLLAIYEDGNGLRIRWVLGVPLQLCFVLVIAALTKTFSVGKGGDGVLGEGRGPATSSHWFRCMETRSVTGCWCASCSTDSSALVTDAAPPPIACRSQLPNPIDPAWISTANVPGLTLPTGYILRLQPVPPLQNVLPQPFIPVYLWLSRISDNHGPLRVGGFRLPLREESTKAGANHRLGRCTGSGVSVTGRCLAHGDTVPRYGDDHD